MKKGAATSGVTSKAKTSCADVKAVGAALKADVASLRLEIAIVRRDIATRADIDQVRSVLRDCSKELKEHFDRKTEELVQEIRTAFRDGR